LLLVAFWQVCGRAHGRLSASALRRKADFVAVHFADLRKCVKPDMRVNVFQQMRFYASKVSCVSGDAGPRSRAAHRAANGVSPPSGFHR